MTQISKRDALRIRTATMLVGVALCCISAAGAFHWITIDRTGNLVLGIILLLFIIVSYAISRWLRSHSPA